MNEILTLLPVLSVAILMNLGAGLYYSIGTKKTAFNSKIFLSGIIKAAIIAGMFIGTAYCFEATDLSSIGVTPIFVMTSAIILYVGKALISLGKILGLEIKTKQERFAMTLNEFIQEIASYVQKYAPKYGILVHSPIIAQAILESARGTSELAVNAHNYFGLKYKANRCPTASGIYYKVGSEQKADGSYTSSAMQWMKFDNMEQCVIGYFDFINNTRYENLKGIIDPKEYLKRIKEDGYATSLNYVNNLILVIKRYDLSKYDIPHVNVRKIIAIDAGHGMKTAGKRCLKSIDPNQTREWYLNDRIADRLQLLLEDYHCRVIRVDDTTGAKDIPLATRVQSANNANADIYISIHHNAGINGKYGGGTIVYYYSAKPEVITQASKLYDLIVRKTGLVGNRSQKTKNQGFYVIKHTSMPAFLIENGFMDSLTDTPIILTSDHALKTAEGILTFLVTELSLVKNDYTEDSSTPMEDMTNLSSRFTAKGVDYSLVFNPGYYSGKYTDLKTAFGTDEIKLFEHFCHYGMKEGRQAIISFDVNVYKNTYEDLRIAFGNDLPSYYKHFIEYGRKEKRSATS